MAKNSRFYSKSDLSLLPVPVGEDVFYSRIFYPRLFQRLIGLMQSQKRKNDHSNRRRSLTVLLHGLGEDASSMHALARELLNQGEPVMLVELPFHGQHLKDQQVSELSQESINYLETLTVLEDLLLATLKNERLQPTHINFMGHSLGGGFSLLLSSRLHQRGLKVAKVFLLAPFSFAIDRYRKNEALSKSGFSEKQIEWIERSTPESIKAIVYRMTVTPLVNSSLPQALKEDLGKPFFMLTEEEKAEFHLRFDAIRKTIFGSRDMDVRDHLVHLPEGIKVHVMIATEDKLLPEPYHLDLREHLQRNGIRSSLRRVESNHMIPQVVPQEVSRWFRRLK